MSWMNHRNAYPAIVQNLFWSIFTLVTVLSPHICGQMDLFEAIRNDDLRAVSFRLQHGADPNTQDRSGTTAAMEAALYGSPACLRLLLDRGADPNRANQAGSTALMWGSSVPAKTRLLAARGARINTVSNSGRTPLIVASSVRGNVESVRILLDFGADVRVRDSEGIGPVLAASQVTDVQTLLELLNHGGDPNEESSLGQTPLMNAAGYGSAQAVKILLRAGADVNHHSKEPLQLQAGLQRRGHLTALLWAAPFSAREIIVPLISKGADPNFRDYRGMNALMLASTSESPNIKIIRLLLRITADPNSRDNNGLTALDWALKAGNSGVAEILRRAGMHRSTPGDEDRPLPSGSTEIQSAVEKSIILLQHSGDSFFRATGCLACHHTMLVGLLVGEAKSRGLAVDETIASSQLRKILAVRMPEREAMLLQRRPGGFPMTSSLLLTSLSAQKYPADSLTDALAIQILAAQQEDGSWHGFDQRPPSEFSSFSETAYAIRAVRSYAPPGWRRAAQSQVDKAAYYLYAAKATTTEEKVMQLLGLRWSGVASEERLQHLAHRLLVEQGLDGGWAQRNGFQSDAYATGQVLYALNQAARVSIAESAYQKGVLYLLGTQNSDGSWFVKSRSVDFQPYFESGFPFGRDQWISTAATCWAALSLALTIEDRQKPLFESINYAQ